MLTHKSTFLKAWATPEQMQKLHVFAKDALKSYLPIQVDDHTSEKVYSFAEGVPCVEILSSKYDATQEHYWIEIRVITAIRTKNYRWVNLTGDEGRSESGFWIFTPPSILCEVLRIIGLLPKAVVDAIEPNVVITPLAD